eukprot:7804229-Alexandrium_andersonii.AAC.1
MWRISRRTTSPAPQRCGAARAAQHLPHHKDVAHLAPHHQSPAPQRGGASRAAPPISRTTKRWRMWRMWHRQLDPPRFPPLISGSVSYTHLRAHETSAHL